MSVRGPRLKAPSRAGGKRSAEFFVFRLPIAIENAISYAVDYPLSAAAIFYHIHGTSRNRVRSQYSP